MTVCIAAISSPRKVVCVSDRMKTANQGVVEFEPEISKIHIITDSIVCMGAGDSNANIEILNRLKAEIGVNDPENRDKLSINEVIRRYSDFYFELRNEKSEASILKPIGLDFNRLYDKQKSLPTDTLEGILHRLASFRFSVEAIIAGVDDSGAHLYTVKNGQIDCWNGLGFCSIGIGQSHADLSFMQIGHSPYDDPLITLWLAFLAKKNAEMSAGVGKETDIYLTGPKGFGLAIPQKAMDVLIKMHEELINRADTLGEEHFRRLAKAMVELTKKSQKVKKTS